jgi:hypothetical protein
MEAQDDAQLDAENGAPVDVQVDAQIDAEIGAQARTGFDDGLTLIAPSTRCGPILRSRRRR